MPRRLIVFAFVWMAVAVPATHAAVHATRPSPTTLPGSFAGISVETTLVPSWFGVGCASAARAALAMLGRPEIRVGGNSQDRLWPNAPLPPGQNQVAGPDYFHALHCLSAIGSPVMVGLNLLGQNSQATGDLLAAVKNVVDPKLLTISLGNEPNAYGSRLPAPGGYPGFLTLYGQMLSDLQSRFGASLPPVAGPDAGTTHWTEETARFVTDQAPAQVDDHLYGLSGCRQTPGTPTYPTIDQLLTPQAASSLVGYLNPVVAAANEAGIPAQISEANSVACSGVAGVSDSAESGLWAMSLLGGATTVGFSRVEFHASGGSYDPFVIAGDNITFRPEWLAMMLANRLWPVGTRPMHLTGTLQKGIGAWIAQRPGGSLAAMIVNYDRTNPHTLVLRTTKRAATVGRVTVLNPTTLTLDGRRPRLGERPAELDRHQHARAPAGQEGHGPGGNAARIGCLAAARLSQAPPSPGLRRASDRTEAVRTSRVRMDSSRDKAVGR